MSKPSSRRNRTSSGKAAREASAKTAGPREENTDASTATSTSPSGVKKSSWLPALEDEAPPPAAVERGALLVTEGLVKDYGDGLGLRGIDLLVDRGELVMLVGPNGAGKSTLLGLAAGLIEPTAGRVFAGGFKAGTIEARAATSYIPDAPVLYEDLSVREHIEYIARLHNTADWEEYGAELLEMFRLSDRADDLPTTFSRGLKQKTALIIGLIRPFDLLLIDEPFVGLDTPGQETLVEVLADLVDQGASVFCSTHQLDLLPKATRCVGLRDGELEYDGAPSAEKIRALVGG
ncbi:MAG: ABC transporter ATP-binding protein [Acidimicrobiales bacterium]|nr:ABC transporter ATP-binding protein [Acidimicrobiales bacterium]